MIPLSPRTKAHLLALFDTSSVEAALELLERECADTLPIYGEPTPESLERIRFAALRVSEGRLELLLEAVVLAQTDWRDLLVAAGFADDVTAHEHWQPGR